MTTSSCNIELQNITQVFRGPAARSTGGKFTAVGNVSFNLMSDPPGITSLVGQSGSGKSTIAYITLGLQKTTQGNVTYREKDIYNWY